MKRKSRWNRWTGKGQNKNSDSFIVCTTFCMQLWLTRFTRFVIFFKRKTAVQPQLYSQKGVTWHLCGRADLLSGFMKVGHFQYAITAVLCGAKALLLEQTAGQVMFWHHACRCELKARGSYHTKNCRKPFVWGGNDHNKKLTMYSRSGWPIALLVRGCAVVSRESCGWVGGLLSMGHWVQL